MKQSEMLDKIEAERGGSAPVTVGDMRRLLACDDSSAAPESKSASKSASKRTR